MHAYSTTIITITITPSYIHSSTKVGLVSWHKLHSQLDVLAGWTAKVIHLGQADLLTLPQHLLAQCWCDACLHIITIAHSWMCMQA